MIVSAIHDRDSSDGKGLSPVIRYIENQPEHHRKVTFQEEFRKFLARCRVAYDEQYVWD